MIAISLVIKATAPAESRRADDYEFRPDAKTLLAELLPATVRIRLFQAFLDASVSEQVEAVANGLLEAFLAGRISELHVAYMRFHSAARQRQSELPVLRRPQMPPA